jgi:hypothetical protein
MPLVLSCLGYRLRDGIMMICTEVWLPIRRGGDCDHHNRRDKPAMWLIVTATCPPTSHCPPASPTATVTPTPASSSTTGPRSCSRPAGPPTGPAAARHHHGTRNDDLTDLTADRGITGPDRSSSPTAVHRGRTRTRRIVASAYGRSGTRGVVLVHPAKVHPLRVGGHYETTDLPSVGYSVHAWAGQLSGLVLAPNLWRLMEFSVEHADGAGAQPTGDRAAVLMDDAGPEGSGR